MRRASFDPGLVLQLLSQRPDTYQMDVMVLAEDDGALLGLQLLLLLGLHTLILTDDQSLNMQRTAAGPGR